MNQSEKITATVKGDGTGNVVIPSTNNPKYGYIKVAQVRTDIDEETGFAKMRPMTALIPGEIPALKSFGWKEGQEVEGKIYVKEQLKPFNAKDPEKDIKQAGETGVNCTLGGAPIYRKHFFSKNVNVEDIRVQHDNTEEIKAAYITIKAQKEAEEAKAAETANIGKM